MKLRPASKAGRYAAPGRPPRVFPGYVVDLDGTVYLGDQPLPGAVQTLGRIRAAGSAWSS